MSATHAKVGMKTPASDSTFQRSNGSGLHIGTLDRTPVSAGTTALPGLLGIAFGAYIAARIQRPRWPPVAQLILAVAWFGLFEIADTLHTLGHIYSARQVYAPVDRVALASGLQVTVYDKHDVAPRQHVGRALGGPLASGALTTSAFSLYSLFRRIPVLSALTEAWLFSNAIILAGALTPTPHFDGASILKWAVTGQTGEEALGDEAVQQAGSLTIGVLGMAAILLALRGKWRWSGAALLAVGIAALDLFILNG
ncbi:MAG: hypothetical protein ACYDBJ_19555, partial [Aggregatilineales bacterium]